mgnify:CR=1 FL=1
MLCYVTCVVIWHAEVCLSFNLFLLELLYFIVICLICNASIGLSANRRPKRATLVPEMATTTVTTAFTVSAEDEDQGTK